MTTITERVAAGAAFLDEHDPEWWRADVERAIDLDVLELADSGLCVLGQRCPLEVLARCAEVDVDGLSALDFGEAYDAYAQHLSGLGGLERSTWGADLGFVVLVDTGKGWDALTAEWKRVITERRSAS